MWAHGQPQDCPHLHNEFKPSLSHMTPCLRDRQTDRQTKHNPSP